MGAIRTSASVGRAKARELAAPIAEETGYTVDEILGDGRTSGVVAARYHLIVTLWRATGMSTTEVGSAVGGRDHSTIIYALRKVLGNEAYKRESAARLEGRTFEPPPLAPLRKVRTVSILEDIETRLGRIEEHLGCGGEKA